MINLANNLFRIINRPNKIQNKQKCPITKQAGVFTIELVLILIGFSLIIVFTMDVIVKQSVKGKLDRLSYSLVNVLRERTQLFNNSERMTYAEASQSYRLIQKSLQNTLDTFEDSRLGLFIEQQQFDDEKKPITPIANLHYFNMGNYDCKPNTRLSKLTHLAPVTKFGNKLTLYQVSLCYRTDNWIGDLVGVDFKQVRSISVSFGR